MNLRKVLYNKLIRLGYKLFMFAARFHDVLLENKTYWFHGEGKKDYIFWEDILYRDENGKWDVVETKE